MRKNKTVPNKEVDMNSIADSSVSIQMSSESVPATPSWFGEVALLIPYLRKQGVLSAISAQVHLARRFGHYEVIDFLAVLFGYAISGERTLEAFYEQLLPLAQPFMALFERDGRYRDELRRALPAVRGYIEAYHLSPSSALLRLDGQYGTGAVLTDLAGFSFVMRGKDYSVLDRPEVQSRLHLPADQQFSRPESELVRTLYDCPDVAVGPNGQRCRVVVATHPANAHKSRVGLTRKGVVYELFFTALPQDAFTASDVVALYLHRGAFEPVLADEDQEQDPDRWCSHAPAGQEAWQIVSQWVWNLRLELGHMLEPTPLRTTEFALPIKEPTAEQAPVQGYEKPAIALRLQSGAFLGAGLRSPA